MLSRVQVVLDSSRDQVHLPTRKNNASDYLRAVPYIYTMYDVWVYTQYLCINARIHVFMYLSNYT